MKAVWPGLALLAALLLQSAVSQILPNVSRVLDPFLLILVYCGLTDGETHGMLVGTAAGWVQDIHFGGSVVGLTGLTGLLLGFAVGVAGTRFLIVGTAPRLIVLFAATLVQTLLFERLALLFDIQTHELALSTLFARAVANALVGALAFEILDQRRARSRPVRS
jgi:cell shape-determining protein MreD